jgi:hypothetical protein
MADCSSSGSSGPRNSRHCALLIACAFACLLPVLLAASGASGDLRARERTSTPTHALSLSLFTHSENCLACHNKLVAPSGEDVSIGSTWRSTMMANSARDPYWLASVRREMIDHPTRAGETQDECAACHMPMSRRISREAGGRGEVFAQKPEPQLQHLAADGVSCTVCHQIAPETLAQRDNFNANFLMRPTRDDGARDIFGPYQIDAGRKTIMRSVTGFVQAQATHIKDSALCASCHTLITTAYGANGEVIGSLPEQMNYQEWQHSDFEKEARSCQSCHMPAVPGPVRIASVLGDARASLARHVFVGGNAHMVRLLNRYRDELGVEAMPNELEATAQATLRQLQEQTATISLSPPRVVGGTVEVDVEVRNLTGHKFPTGYPARRAWLHVTVRDADGRVMFESGAIDETGAIRGNDNDRDPQRYEPHYTRITSADQVQIYESILGDRANAVTTGLQTATQYLKDNRLLPRGFDKTTADPTIGVFGDAARDADFSGGSDRVRYAVPIAVANPDRVSVEVELRFQAIGYRWALNLERYDAHEPSRFVSYYKATAEDSSVVIASSRYLLPITN